MSRPPVPQPPSPSALGPLTPHRHPEAAFEGQTWGAAGSVWGLLAAALILGVLPYAWAVAEGGMAWEGDSAADQKLNFTASLPEWPGCILKQW